jgi:hypothetical protein
MKFKKIIRKVGDCIGLYFSRSEARTYNIEVGDYIDLTDAVIIKAKKHNKK